MQFLKNKKILVISPESWSHIPVSKHHYTKVLAKNGNDVYFLNPPSDKNGVVEDPAHKGVKVVDYVAIPGVNRLPSFLRNWINRYQIRSLEKLCGAHFDVVWSFDAFRFQNLHLFGAQINLYHAVDVHISPLEMELASTAHLIISVSQKILDRYTFAKKVMQKINHGLGAHFFEEVEPIQLPNAPLHVGYVGNLDNWCIDIPTLLEIVDTHPSIHFTFIGPYKQDSVLANALRDKSNCTLIGRVPTEKLPTLFQQFHFFVMVYKGDEVDVNSNHHKILEYLTTGKPVVMNYTDEYNDKRELVVMSDQNQQLPLLFQQVCINFNQYATDDLISKRKAFAFSNSYQQHVVTIDQLMVHYLATAND
ncbi:MAG: glycosyltransferase [Cyclobacteriaceae bacterium]|jgi:hypothetical protein